MRTEEEIKKQIEAGKDQLVGASGESVPRLQGYILGLEFALSEKEKPEAFRD